MVNAIVFSVVKLRVLVPFSSFGVHFGLVNSATHLHHSALELSFVFQKKYLVAKRRGRPSFCIVHRIALMALERISELLEVPGAIS